MGKSTFLQDFKAFAMKGNVIDMAVGVIIGGAFGKIVSSVVADRLAGGWRELYGPQVGAQACRDAGRAGGGCGCHPELRQLPPGDVRLPRHRLFRLPLRAPAFPAEPQAGEADRSRRSSRAQQRGAAPDGNPRPADGTKIISLHPSSRGGRPARPVPFFRKGNL